MNGVYEQHQQSLLFFMIFGPNMSFNIIKLYMDGFYIQRAFHRVQEHLKRSSDEEIMTIRSLRLPMNSGYEQPAGPTIFVISRPNMSSNIIKLYMIDYRLKGLCIESKNIQNGVRMKNL